MLLSFFLLVCLCINYQKWWTKVVKKNTCLMRSQPSMERRTEESNSYSNSFLRSVVLAWYTTRWPNRQRSAWHPTPSMTALTSPAAPTRHRWLTVDLERSSAPVRTPTVVPIDSRTIDVEATATSSVVDGKSTQINSNRVEWKIRLGRENQFKTA